MIYDIDGNPLQSVYGKDGDMLAQAYNINGNQLLDPKPDLVVMTYNVEWFSGINANRSMQAEIFDAYDADIIGLEELQQNGNTRIPTLATQLLSANYPHIMMGNYGNKNGIASKYPLSNFTTVVHTVQPNPQDSWGGQSYSTATITVKGKEIFLLVGHNTTHKYGREAMASQVKEIFDALQGHEYFIVMADLNTAYCRNAESEDYTTFLKQFADAGYNFANCYVKDGEFIAIDTWSDSYEKGRGTWEPDDHIITSSNISIDKVIVDERKLAVAAQTKQYIDHCPIIAELTIK